MLFNAILRFFPSRALRNLRWNNIAVPTLKTLYRVFNVTPRIFFVFIFFGSIEVCTVGYKSVIIRCLTRKVVYLEKFSHEFSLKSIVEFSNFQIFITILYFMYNLIWKYFFFYYNFNKHLSILTPRVIIFNNFWINSILDLAIR